jgi:uroporphyrinogen decarboxylase
VARVVFCSSIAAYAPPALYGDRPVTEEEDLMKPADVRICEGAAEGAFNMAHICGEENDFALYTDYPVHALNWSDRKAGPSIREARGMTDKCLAGGIDHNTVDEKSADELREEVRRALEEGGRTRYVLAAGCSVPNDIAEERLAALGEAARAAG